MQQLLWLILVSIRLFFITDVFLHKNRLLYASNILILKIFSYLLEIPSRACITTPLCVLQHRPNRPATLVKSWGQWLQERPFSSLSTRPLLGYVCCTAHKNLLSTQFVHAELSRSWTGNKNCWLECTCALAKLVYTLENWTHWRIIDCEIFNSRLRRFRIRFGLRSN